MAAATTSSTVKPNFFMSFCKGADSPKILMPTRAPSIPTYRSQPNLAASSTETRALICGGNTEEFPPGHANHSRLHALFFERLLRIQAQRNLASRADQQYVRFPGRCGLEPGNGGWITGVLVGVNDPRRRMILTAPRLWL